MRGLLAPALLVCLLCAGAIRPKPATADPAPEWLRLAPSLGETPAGLRVSPLDPARRREIADAGHGTVDLVQRIDLRIGRERIERRILLVRQFLSAALDPLREVGLDDVRSGVAAGR